MTANKGNRVPIYQIFNTKRKKLHKINWPYIRTVMKFEKELVMQEIRVNWRVKKEAEKEKQLEKLMVMK